MKKNTLLITVFILIILAFAGYGYYRLFVAPDLPPVTQQPEVVLVGSHEIFSPGRTFLISDNYAYIDTGALRIEIIDISNPSNPVSVGTIMSFYVHMEEITALFSSNNYLYVAGAVGIEIYDVSNPAKPEGVGFYRISSPYSLVGIDNYLFVGTGHGLSILDISDPAKPVLVKKHSEDFLVHDLFLANNLIYMIGRGEVVEVSPSVFELKDNIRVLDISDRTNPVLVGKYKKQMDRLRKIYIHNGIAYITHYSVEKNGLTILDTSDLISLPLLGNYEFGMDSTEIVRSVYVFDKYAYIISNKKLFILDVSDSAKPVLVKTVDKNSLHAISGAGEYIYLICLSPERVPQFQILEIR